MVDYKTDATEDDGDI